MVQLPPFGPCGWKAAHGGQALRHPTAPAILIAVLMLLAAAGLPAPAAAASLNLIINDQVVQADVGPSIISGRTMVPIRVVSEHLGALVNWREDAREVHISYGGRRVVLPVGSTTARVDDRSIPLDAPARIESGRTLVPLRFVVEALGAGVSWEEASRTVRVERLGTGFTGASFMAGSTHGLLTLHLSGSADFRATALDAQGSLPPRLMVEIEGAHLATAGDLLAVGQAGVTRVLWSEPAEGRVRVLVELTEPVTWKIDRAANGRDLVVSIGYKVTGVDYRYTPEGPAVFVQATGPVSPRVFTLSSPHRLVIDLPHATTGSGLPRALDMDNPLVRRIRAAQFEPDVVRVAVDLNRSSGYSIREDEQGLAVHLHGLLEDVTWELREGRARIHLHGELALGYHARLEGGDLVIDLPYTVPALSTGSRDVGLGPIRTLSVESMAGGNPHPPGTRIIVGLAHATGFQVVGDGPASRVTIELSASVLQGKVVVVDPGHGGRDPGGISISGVFEKHLTLVIAAHLRNLLENAGARVIMTRTADTGVDLYDRAGLANRARADIFVSVHLNAYRHDQMAGTETYHYPNSATGRRLAEFVHASMLRNLGRPDRGIRTADFVVLRETSMPAVLVEALYITHPQEERLARDPDYQIRIAQAIFEGLLDYFR